MTISEFFYSDPTRTLEEVQKINARERAETDVAEFYETESAERVLRRLGETIETHPGEAARFLYIHATFGSGKTHLLKLVGLVADTTSEFAYLGDRLAERWSGFDDLRRSIDVSHVDRLTPVFLNLLDRDASKEPPLPFLIYEAIGRELGYPTDPNWLLQWAWTLDMEYDGVWDALQELESDGRTFESVLDERASLRSWLYDAVPTMAETDGTALDDSAAVKASIETAVDDVEPASFDPDELVTRVETATDALNGGRERTELLLGLDEVALFVGDSQQRYREFEETMDALQRGPNPVVVTTGQYSLPDTRESLIGEPPENHWTEQQIPLEGADTEIIVRKRWLRKSDDGTERVANLLADAPELTLHTYAPITSSDPDPVESYPFREYDLTLLRQVMQELITQGRETDREYIQGRALLVLVRSLFTKFDWADADAGEIVTWDVLFDLLVEETTYVPLWVQEMLDNTLIPTFGNESADWRVRLAKTLYLVNQTPAVPATTRNVARLMVADVTATLDDVTAKTEAGLQELVDKQKALEETTDDGDEVYTLVSEEQESILSRAQDEAGTISPHQLSAWLETRLRENDSFFKSEGTRHEVDVGDARAVPLRYEYSVLEPVDRAPTPEYDALRVRVLAADDETLLDQIETWQEVNDGHDGREHLLIAVEIPGNTLDRIRKVIGMGNVLDNETESHEELEREHRTDRRRLEASVTQALDEATVYTTHDAYGSRTSKLTEAVEDQIDSVFGSSRRTLSLPLRAQDDAKAIATFFRGGGDWPLSPEDAAMLGVNVEAAEIGPSGWCREFIERYESQQSVDVESLLQQTRTVNGAYRGTPRESIAALLITLATSNESVALKVDADYLTDPAAIGRQVSTKGGMTAIQVRFGVEVLDPKAVRSVVSTVLGGAPDGEGPDDWLAELSEWVREHSTALRRTLKGVDREFGVSLDAFEAFVDPVLSGETLSTADIGSEDDLDRVGTEAETFVTARDLFVTDDGTTLWAEFTDELDRMTSFHPGASHTARMRATAEGETVPSTATVEQRISDARTYRLDALTEQYRRITGATSDATDPDEVLGEITAWVRSNEAAVRAVCADARETFDGVDIGELVGLFEAAWDGEELREGALVDAAVETQAATYAQCRVLLEARNGSSLWTRLGDAAEDLRANHADSPTTDAVDAALAASRPPSERRVEQLLEQAADPRDPTKDELWHELQAVAEELRQELPNAAITDRVTAATDAAEPGDRPEKAEARELLREAQTVLDRLADVQERFDDLSDGSIVIVESSASGDRS